MAVLLFGLHAFAFQPFESTIKDPFWRVPLFMLVFGCAGLATYPPHALGKWLSHKITIISRLKDLTPHEKKVLRRYLENQSTAEAWGRGGGSVDTLCRDGILVLLSTDPDPKNRLPDVYGIERTAWKYIRSHPELIAE